MVRQVELLRTLVAHGVQFIVVGGAAAVLQGVPVNTLDIDIVYERSETNIQALLGAFAELEAVFRTDPRKLRPSETHLRSAGHKLLATRFGVLDVLGTVEDETDYAELTAHAERVSLGDFSVLVLSLERLVAMKRKLTRPKDKLMLVLLEAALDERTKRNKS